MKKLLIADDVATNLRLVTELLKGEYEVATAKSGEQALYLIPIFKPDIILLDIGMPQMDGYKVMDRIRQNPDMANIPVIFLTGDTSKEAEAKALRIGAMDYVRKPFEPEVLRSRIEKALNIADIRNGLEESSKKDSLTGLWNRSYIEDIFENKKISETGYLMMLDLDNFKGLNDSCGHQTGDKALACFASVLSDISNKDDIVCRLGGDEFIIFKNGFCEREELREFARNLISQVEYKINDLIEDELNSRVSVSVGIAEYPKDGEDFTHLYNSADKALYFVKQNGKRGYHFYQEAFSGKSSFDRENSLIDLAQLKLLIQENDINNGAYQVEYEGFKRIYRFVNRCVSRTGQNVQIVLFTLTLKDGCTDSSYMDRAMESLEEDTTGLLRRADVATQYSDNQYVIILMDTTKENGLIAVNRVLDGFKKRNLDQYIIIDYDIQDVEKE